MKQESDLLLIQRIRKNDPKAWSELDRRYRGRLRAFVRRRLNGRPDARKVGHGRFNCLDCYCER